MTEWTFPFRSDRTTFLTLFLGSGLLVVHLFVFPAHCLADRSVSAIKSRLTQTNIDQFKRYSTFKIDKKAKFPTDTETVHFLLDRLQLTCAIIRGWKLEAFEAREIEPQFYHARDGAGLEGYILRTSQSDTKIIFTGSGQFSSEKLPLTLRGNAVSEIRIIPSDTDVRVGGTLHVKVSNPIIHLMSQIFYPVIKTLANNKSTHLMNVAKKTIRKINQYPDKTSRRLSTIDSSLKDQWIQFQGRRSTDNQ